MTEQDKIHIWDRFDKIVCIHYLPYMEERFGRIKAELDRVGILDCGRFFWELTTPNPIYDYIRIPSEKNSHDKGITKASKVYTLHYYSLLKKFQLLGYEHVLILEDDIAFRKDVDEISKIVNAAPEDYDILNLDPFRRNGWNGAGKGYWGHYYDLKGNEVKNDWDDGLYMRYDSVVYQTSAMAFSKRGIDHIIQGLDDKFAPMDRYTWEGTNGLNTYCTTGMNNICVQNVTNKKMLGGAWSASSQKKFYAEYTSGKFNISQSVVDDFKKMMEVQNVQP